MKNYRGGFNMSKKNVSLNIQEFQDLNLKKLFSKILNILALIERKHFLEKNPDEKANGFYGRQLSSGSVTLDISVPRTRNNSFRPFTENCCSTLIIIAINVDFLYKAFQKLA